MKLLIIPGAMNVKCKQQITVQEFICQQIQANYPANFPPVQVSSQGWGPYWQGSWKLEFFAVVPVWGVESLSSISLSPCFTGLKSQLCHMLAVWLWASCLLRYASVFSSIKQGCSWYSVKIQLHNLYKVVNTVPAILSELIYLLNKYWASCVPGTVLDIQ